MLKFANENERDAAIVYTHVCVNLYENVCIINDILLKQYSTVK